MNLEVMINAIKIYEGKTNLCDHQLLRPEIVELCLAGFGIPNQCSIASNFTFYRNNEKVLIFSKSFKKIISAFAVSLSEYEIKVVMDHDTGKSCFKIVLVISKNKIH